MKSTPIGLQGCVAAMIIPPPDIRTVIDGVVRSVRVQGKNYEAGLLSAERSNPKYSFLNPNDPYYPYYNAQLTGKSNGTLAPEPKTTSPTEPAQTKTVNGSELLPNAIEKVSMSSFDLDLIKLTSIWAAMNDSSFVSTLVSREMRNTQFDFLKIGHSYNQAYKSLVQAYALLLEGNPINFGKDFSDALDQIESLADDPQFSKTSEPATEYSLANNESIDWNSFVIGDVVEFFVTDTIENLPVPISSAALIGCSVSNRIFLYDQLLTESGQQRSANVVTSLAKEQFVICPVCKGRVLASQYDNHVRLETASSTSSKQHQVHLERMSLAGSEVSAGQVLSNVDKLLSKRTAYQRMEDAKR